MSEKTIPFGSDSGLIGTVSVPSTPPKAGSRVGVLLFNAGIVHRVGPHRINVYIARELAARGIPAIRFDLAGHGDSARLTGAHSFEAQAVIDVRAAMDALGATANVTKFVIFGYCSGAYHGFAAALEDERVAGLVMYDAYRYPTIKTHLYHYLDRLREPKLLPRVFGVLRGAIARSAGNEPPQAPELGRINFYPAKADVGAGLRKLLERGVCIRMIYSGGHLRHYNYHRQFRDTFAAFGVADRIPAAFLPESDHVATSLTAHQALLQSIVTQTLEIAGQPAQRPVS